PHAPIDTQYSGDPDGTTPVSVAVMENGTAAPSRTSVPGSVVLTAAPARGSASVDLATGAITYTASGFFRGTDTFQYTFTDSAGEVSNSGTVTVVVNRPMANDDFADTDGNNPVAVNVLDNDT